MKKDFFEELKTLSNSNKKVFKTFVDELSDIVDEGVEWIDEDEEDDEENRMTIIEQEAIAIYKYLKDANYEYRVNRFIKALCKDEEYVPQIAEDLERILEEVIDCNVL